MSLVKQVYRDFTMTWTAASNIRGTDRVCIGWLYGKHLNFCIMTNLKDAIHRDMPKDAPAVGPCYSQHRTVDVPYYTF